MSSPIASPTAATASLKEQPSGPTCRFCEEYCEGSMIQPCSFCKDWWCIACLEGCFVRAAKDSRPFSPPWCCADIQLFRILDRLEPEIASLYRTRYREHMTRNKRWCPVPTCGAFIDVDTLANYHPTRSVTFQCPHCGGNVYNKGCRGIAHSSPCHEKDEAAMLAQYGIKQCPSCKQGVKRMFGCPLMECSCGAYFCWNCCKSPPDCDGGCDAQDSEIGSPNVPNVFVNEGTVSVEDRDERKSPVDGTAGYNSPNAEYDDETDVFAKEDTISVEDRDRWATSRWSSPASRSRSSARSAGVSESETKSKGPLDGMRSPESQNDGGNSTAALNTESFSAAIDQTEREDSILKASNPGTKDTENSEADVVNTTAPKDQEDAIHGEVSLSVEETRHAGPETPDGRVLDLERSRGPSNPDAVNASTAQHLLRRIDTDSHPTGFESSIAQPTTNRLIDLDAGGFSRWANAPENFGADPGESPLSSRVQVWYCIHTPHFFALHWRVKGEYHGDPTPMECNRCVSRVRPMYLFDEDEEKRGDAKEEGSREEEGEDDPSSPKVKQRKLSDSYSAAAGDAPVASTAAVETHYSPRSKACDLDQRNPRNGTGEHSRPDQAWVCWKCASSGTEEQATGDCKGRPRLDRYYKEFHHSLHHAFVFKEGRRTYTDIQTFPILFSTLYTIP